MIVLDLEWNNGFGGIRYDEILQIGAIRLGEDRRICGYFHGFVRPSVHDTFSPPAKMLPDLACSLESEETFPAVYARFCAWCGEERDFAFWGNGDLDVLQQNIRQWGLPPFVCERQFDIQATFTKLANAAGQVALHAAMTYCDIPAPFDFHNAFSDALYTAVIAQLLAGEPLLEMGQWQPGQPVGNRGFSACSFQPKKPQRVGSFSDPTAARNSTACRKRTCPVCGRPIWVQQWRFAEPHYLASFCCKKHGRFLCRLELTPKEDGRWSAVISVPELTTESIEQYRACKDKMLPCVGNKEGKTERRRRQRRAARARKRKAEAAAQRAATGAETNT